MATPRDIAIGVSVNPKMIPKLPLVDFRKAEIFFNMTGSIRWIGEI
jgi:hypothetical protein